MSCQGKNSAQVWPAGNSSTHFADSSSVKAWLRCWERTGKKKQISLLLNEKNPNQMFHILTAQKHTSVHTAKEFLVCITYQPFITVYKAWDVLLCHLYSLTFSSIQREFIYPFYTEVGKRSAESFFQTLQEQFEIITMNAGAQRLASIYTTCI